MKKILLGTAALLGTAVMAQGAAAQVTVKFGGDIRFDAGWIDDDQANSSDLNFVQEVRFPITAEGKADNGLTYGAFIRLRNTGNKFGGGSTAATVNQGENLYAERKYVFVGGDFGRVEMGDEWGAVTKLTGFAPSVGIGQLDGDFGKWTDVGLFTYVPFAYYDRSTKITYYTPRFGGFQAGVGYTPEVGQSGDNNNLARRLNTTNSYSDRFELAANYKGEFGAVTVDLGGSYAFADTNISGLEDYSSWGVSAAVGYGAFLVGGNYFDNNETGQASVGAVDYDGWNVGVSYDGGVFQLAAAYGRSSFGSLDDSMWTLGAVYNVAPGLSLQADLYVFDAETAAPIGKATPGNDGTVLMIRTNLLF